MGTHPIFESDFDCLTEQKKDGICDWHQRQRLRLNWRRSIRHALDHCLSTRTRQNPQDWQEDCHVCGEVGDTNFFTESISKNIALYEIRNGYGMSPDEAAAYTRQYLAQSMRSRKSYQVNLLLAGYDDI